MAITKKYSPTQGRMPAGRSAITASRRPVTAGTSITSNVRSRQNTRTRSRIAANYAGLTPAQAAFAKQIQANCRKSGAIMGATNTSNIAAKPDFMELIPLFTQQLLLLDVFGSVAMKSRQQLVPYFKFVAENTKGETTKGDILNSPFVNRQGLDPNFTGRLIKNEAVTFSTGSSISSTLAYYPILPGSVIITATIGGVAESYTDDGAGNLLAAGTTTDKGDINYSTGAITLTLSSSATAGTDTIVATYQYDNETVDPDANGEYGAQMAKGYLDLDEINLVAEAMEIACYWSVYSAFAAQNEYGADLGAMAKESAFGELTAELNSKGFKKLADAAQYKAQYNWDAAPVKTSVVPSDYLNMFKLKLEQAAASIYSATHLSQPNWIIVGTDVAAYMKMINGFQAASTEDAVGPYRLGKLDQFNVICDPNYEPNKWVMGCKSSDIRRNSALFGEYMPFTDTASIGLANMSVQQGYCTMCAMEIVNPASIVSGKIVGTF